MSLKRDVQAAYDQVHAPEDAVERLKRELREKDLRGDAEESAEPEGAPRPQFWRYAVYVAAVFAVFGCGFLAWRSVQDNRVELHPGSQVTSQAELPDVTGMPLESARELLEQYGCQVEIVYEKSDRPAGTVTRIDARDKGSVQLFVSAGE